jgi:hypothetical protein
VGGRAIARSGGWKMDTQPGKAPAGPAVTRATRLRRLVTLCVAGAAGYGLLAAARAWLGVPLPDAVVVGVPFLLVPAGALWWWGEPAQWGRLDRGFLLSVAAYAPFAAWVVLSIPAAPSKYFAPLASILPSLPAGPVWVVATFLHVGAVDYFTKRVVQLESETLWGPRPAQALQLTAWCAGHVVEWLWLREVLGDAGAAAFLVAAGAVTGWVYARWKCVAGLMAGHLMVNLAAAAGAIAAYG